MMMSVAFSKSKDKLEVLKMPLVVLSNLFRAVDDPDEEVVLESDKITVKAFKMISEWANAFIAGGSTYYDYLHRSKKELPPAKIVDLYLGADYIQMDGRFFRWLHDLPRKDGTTIEVLETLQA